MKIYLRKRKIHLNGQKVAEYLGLPPTMIFKTYGFIFWLVCYIFCMGNLDEFEFLRK
ncbi:hypothetical protein [Faecalimonas sp.]